MVSDHRIRALWIGTAESELAEAHQCLCQSEQVVVATCATFASAVDWLAQQDRLPELIVYAQLRPGEVSRDDVEHICRQAPLSRVVSLLGSWCEGETRSGHPPPAAERIYWHQWPMWLARELTSLERIPRGAWMLPSTVTAEERLLALCPSHTDDQHNKLSGAVAIFSRRLEIGEMLGHLLSKQDAAAVYCQHMDDVPPGCSLAIWDSDRCGDKEANELRSLADAVSPAPVVALMTFPRLEEQRRALEAGAMKMLSKPLVLDELTLLARQLPAGTTIPECPARPDS